MLNMMTSPIIQKATIAANKAHPRLPARGLPTAAVKSGEREQRLFRCLGVFVGRVTLDAIATVDRAIAAGGDEANARADGDPRGTGRTLRHLLSLAEKSLILPARSEASSQREVSPIAAGELVDDETAFGVLETVRELAGSDWLLKVS